MAAVAGVKVGDSRSSIATDPLRNFRFRVRINHRTAHYGDRFLTLGFMTCSGLSMETAVVAYREGHFNTTPQKMPGQTDFPPLTLSRGSMPKTPAALHWMDEIFIAIAGTGYGAPSKKESFRSTINIDVMTHPTTKSTVPILLRFDVYNAWPSSLAYSDLDAGGNAVLMEQMVIQHEGWRPTYAKDAFSSLSG